MSSATKLMCAIGLLAVPTIQYGGYFLLTLLTGKQKMTLTDFQRSMFRAGHAHAGVLLILALVAEILADYANLAPVPEWMVRIGFPLASILVSGGFFAAAVGANRTTPSRFIWILYLGIASLAINTIILGIGLIKSI